MPFKKKYHKKKKFNYRKKQMMRHVPRIMTPKTFQFKRDIEQVISLSSGSAPEGWNLDGTSRVYTTLGWSLSSIPENIDFVSLFRQYRLKGARVRMYFSNTISGTEEDSVYANSQLLVRMAPNQRGSNDVLGNSYWQQIQAKKYKLAINGGKPLDFYMPLKQPNTLQSSTGTAPSLISPKWIASNIGNIVHYGANLSVERVDGQSFTTGFNNAQRVKIITTIYLQTRGVY